MFYGFVSQLAPNAFAVAVLAPSSPFQPSTFVYNSKLDQYITTHNKMVLLVLWYDGGDL